MNAFMIDNEVIRGLFVFAHENTASHTGGGGLFCYEITLPNCTVFAVQS